MMETMSSPSGSRRRGTAICAVSWTIALLVLWSAPGSACALDHISFRNGGQQKTITGKIEVEAQDGGLLVITPDGTLWTVEREHLVSKKSDDEAFHPLSRDELTKQMLA